MFPRGSGGVSRLEFGKGWFTKRNDGALGGFSNRWGLHGVIGLGIRAFKGRYGNWRTDLLE